MVLTRCGDLNTFTTEGIAYLTILLLGVDDDNICVLIRQEQIDDLLLCKKRLTRTGNTCDKAITVEQFPAIDHDHILADGVIGKIDSVSVCHFLYSERHKYGKRFCRQGSAHGELRHTIRKNGIESLKLLPT